MYRKFFEIRLNKDNSKYVVYNLKGKRLKYKKELYVSPVIAPIRTIKDIKKLFKTKE